METGEKILEKKLYYCCLSHIVQQKKFIEKHGKIDYCLFPIFLLKNMLHLLINQNAKNIYIKQTVVSIYKHTNKRTTNIQTNCVRTLESAPWRALLGKRKSWGPLDVFVLRLPCLDTALEATRLIAISSLVGFWIETTIGTTFCVSGDQNHGNVFYRIPW